MVGLIRTVVAATAFVPLGIGVQTLGAIGMQWTTRAIGAAAVSSVSSLRLVASVVGSVVVLQETPTHPMIWCGFVVVVATMSAYTAVQYKGQRWHLPLNATAAGSSQDVLPSSSADSNSRVQPAVTAERLDQAGSMSQVDAQALLLASAGSDPSWQLFAVWWDNRPGGVGGRCRSAPVLGQQAHCSSGDIESQQLPQLRRGASKPGA